MKRFAPFAFAFTFALPLIALAQSTTADLDPTSLIANGVKTLFESAQSKNWALFIPTLIVLVVTVFRFIANKFATEGTKFRAFVDNRWTKWGLNFATSFCGALVASATAKAPFTANLVVNALMMSFAAAGGVEFFRDFMNTVSTKKATDAGKNAAADPGPTLNS